MENQLSLSGSIYNNKSSCVIYLKLWPKRNDHIWKILKYFYNSPLQFPHNCLSKRKIEKNMSSDKVPFGINTTANCIRRLQDEGLISVMKTCTGPNKRTTLYAITDKGEETFQTYLSSGNRGGRKHL